MPFPSAAALATTAALVTQTMAERVTLVRPGTPTLNSAGEEIAGAPVEVATVPARVTPQAAPERIEADRLTGAGIYTVRVNRDDDTVTVGVAWSLRWERSASRGGPLTLGVTSVVDDHARGRYLDLLCGVRTPAGASPVLP